MGKIPYKKMKGTPQIRKSIHKPYWYNNIFDSHSEVFILLIVAISGGSGLTLQYISINLLLAILGISVLVIIVLFKICNNFYHRYYRILKVTEQIGQSKDRVHYVIQSCVSHKKLEKIARKKRWRNHDTFYDSGAKESAEYSFDQKTIENKGGETVISQIRKSIYKPTLHQKFLEKNNLRMSEVAIPGILLTIGSFPLLSYLLTTFFHFDIIGVLYAEGISILFGTIVCMLYIRKNHRYLRLVERTVWQGRYKNTSYYLQSFISRKKLEKIVTRKKLKWKHYEHLEFKIGLSKESAFYYFDRETQKKITEEVI